MGITVLALVAGCTAILPGDAEPDGKSLLEDALESDDVPNIVAERTVTFDDADITHTTNERVWKRPPTATRSELISATGFDGGDTNDVIVRNGSTLWMADTETGDVTSFDLESNRSDVPLEERLERYDVTYEGTDTVANRSTHVVSLEPREEAIEQGVGFLLGDTRYVYPLETSPYPDTDLREQTIWLDDEFGYPLKVEQTYADVDGTAVEITVNYDSITFGADLEDGLFDPPVSDDPDGNNTDENDTGETDDGSVSEPESEYVEFETREEAEAYLSFDVPTVAFPEEYERQNIAADTWEGVQTFHEEYQVGEDLLWFSVSEGDLHPDDPDREAVGELDASVETVYETTLVTWTCGELTYELSSSIDEADLLEQAERIGCQ
ncbi:LolA family protein [Natrialbaceae archaeon A-CW3]